jgi:uncharacterized protein YqhQ
LKKNDKTRLGKGNKKKKELMIGGQAVIEGVMMRTREHYAVAVRKEDGSIITNRQVYGSKTAGNKFLGLPFVRGVVVLYETMILGIKALNYSAHAALISEKKKHATKNEFKEAGLDWEIIITLAISVVFALALFKLLPLLAASLYKRVFGGGNLAFNIIDGVAKFAILIGYLTLISLLPDVKRIFQYHGAEHMAVACYEKKKRLTIKNVMGCAKEHPRCGTSFIIYVLVLSIIFYMLIPLNTGFWEKFGVRILFLPIVAGASYELIRLAGRYNNPIIRALTLPGILVQKITTRAPDEKQVEVAIKSLNEAVKD